MDGIIEHSDQVDYINYLHSLDAAKAEFERRNAEKHGIYFDKESVIPGVFDRGELIINEDVVADLKKEMYNRILHEWR